MEEEIAATGPSYYIDLDGAEQGRSMVAIVAARKCYEHRSVADSTGDSKPSAHVKEIAGHCADTADYLLPDTPLKEAIFRMLLAGGNKEKTAEEVSQALEARWAMSSYPKNISPDVVGKLLANSENYGIVAVEEPEPPAEIAAPAVEAADSEVGADQGEAVEASDDKEAGAIAEYGREDSGSPAPDHYGQGRRRLRG